MSRIDSDGSAVVVTDPKKPLHVELENADGDPIEVTVASGTVTNDFTLKDVTPPLDTSAYSSGDVLFIPVAVSVATANAGHALLHSLTIIDKDDNGGALDLVFLSGTAASFGTLNGAVAIDDTDAAKILGIVQVATSDYYDIGGSKVATIPNIGLTLKAESGGLNVYVAGISKDTKTYTGTGLQILIGIAALD